jgi:P-type conjugative transfer protein TrbJ
MKYGLPTYGVHPESPKPASGLAFRRIRRLVNHVLTIYLTPAPVDNFQPNYKPDDTKKEKQMIQTAKRRAVIVALAGTMIVSNAQAGSVAGNGGATEVTQILNNGELVIQSSQLYTEVQQTLQTMNDVHTQLQNLIAAPQQLWGQAQQDLTQLTQLVSQTTAISYAAGNIDQQFRQAYPGYAQSAGATNYGSQYKALIGKAFDGLNSALQAAGMNASQFTSERAAIQQIQGISAGSPGALQAVQAGNMIASQTIDQLQKLRQLIAAQTQSQSNFLAAQAQIQSNQADATQTLMKQGNGTVRQSGQSGFKGF